MQACQCIVVRYCSAAKMRFPSYGICEIVIHIRHSGSGSASLSPSCLYSSCVVCSHIYLPQRAHFHFPGALAILNPHITLTRPRLMQHVQHCSVPLLNGACGPRCCVKRFSHNTAHCSAGGCLVPRRRLPSICRSKLA